MAKEKLPKVKGDDFKAFLGEGSEFSGVLTFEGAVRIYGKFQGEIMTKGTLIVGETAVLNADISAGVVKISGNVQGNVTASSRLEMLNGGQLHGDVRAPVLVVQEGAVLDGVLEMTRQGVKVEGTIEPKKAETKPENVEL